MSSIFASIFNYKTSETASEITGPSHFKHKELPDNLKMQSIKLVMTKLSKILDQVENPLAGLSKEDIDVLKSQAIGLHKHYLENIALSDTQESHEKILETVNQIISCTVGLESKPKVRTTTGFDPSVVSQLKSKLGILPSPLTKAHSCTSLDPASAQKPLTLSLTPLQEKLVFLIQILSKPDYISSEGLFRLSGQVNVLKTLNTQVLDKAKIQQITDVNTIAGFLKKILREMSVPLLQPIKGDLLQVNAKGTCSELKGIIGKLSQESQQTLKMLLEFLSAVAANADKNKMTPVNLAICFVPNLFSMPQTMEEQFAQIQEAAKLNGVFAAMLMHKDQIFN